MRRTSLPCAMIAVGLVIMLIAAAYATVIVVVDAITHRAPLALNSRIRTKSPAGSGPAHAVLRGIFFVIFDI